MYTALCNEEGGIIDDLVTYKLADDRFLLIVNAANTDKDFNWISKQSENFDVKVNNTSDEYGQLYTRTLKQETLLTKM